MKLLDFSDTLGVSGNKQGGAFQKGNPLKKEQWKENQQEDEKLLALFRKGDGNALEMLLKKYSPFLSHASQSSYANLLKDDIKQELFLKFLEACQRYRPGKGTFCGYLTRVLSWKRLDVIRAHKRYNERNVFPGDILYDAIDPKESDQALWEEWEYIKELSKRLKLTPRQEEIFLLWMGGERGTDIAKKLHIPPSYVSRVKNRLQKLLQFHKKDILKDIF